MTDRDGRRGAHVDLGSLLAAGERSYSFEFFPPKTPAGERILWQALRELECLAPTFVSMTYGAGGTTRERTTHWVAEIVRETTLTAVAHLTCVGTTVDDLRRVVAGYADAGVRTVLALRGDPPGGPVAAWTPTPGGLAHAVDLVRLLGELGDFSVGVAAFPEGHPASPDLDTDIAVLRAKQDAGARFAITQFFFRLDDYRRFVDRATAAGVSMPIVPGLMPVTDARQIERFAVLSGAAFPPELAVRFDAVAHDPAAVRDLGVQVATALAADLLAAGAPGLHFYTLNRSTATRDIYANLGLHER